MPQKVVFFFFKAKGNELGVVVVAEVEAEIKKLE